MWLNVLTILRRGGRAMLAAALLLLAWAAPASASTITFGGGAVTGCTLSGSTYNCATIPLINYNDFAVIASGYTVVVSGGFAPGYNQGLTMSGSAALQSTGGAAIDLSSPPSGNISISGGSISASGSFKLGAQSITATVSGASVTTSGQSTITGNVSANGAVSLGDSTTINGSLTASGALTVAGTSTITGTVSGSSITTGSTVKMGALTISGGGSINLGSSNTVSGAVSGGSLTTNSSVTMGALTITGALNLGSSNTVNGSISGASITTSSSVTVTGSVSVSGTADLGSAIKINGNVSANLVKTGSPATIGGSITSTTTIDLGSSTTVGGAISGTTITTTSPVTLNGSVSASTAFTLASGSSVVGNVTSPTVTLSPSSSTVKGNINASSALDIGSGVVVTGTVNAGALTMRASSSVINGNATISNDVDMASGTTINGDLVARNVTTHASSAVINGNAAVNAIYIDWGNSVTKTITCTGPGAVLCSCVTKADSSYNPTCGAAPSSGPHHILITHSGQALTCQAQSVTLKACADASCTSTYNGSTTVALTPNGGNVTITGGSASATVRQSAAGTATLNATGTAVSNSTVCANASTGQASCAMVFSDNGLVLSAPDHVSMTSGVTLNVQALKTSSSGTCVPLVQSTSVPVNFACGYSNPASGTLPLNLGASPTAVACNGVSGGTTAVSLSFDANGLATPSLQYADVGKLDIKASYTAGSLGASGGTSFTAAPKSFKLAATVTASPAATLLNGAFARAGDSFNLTVSAINYVDAVTPNFGRETSPESFNLTESLKLPSDGTNAFTPATFNAISGGVASSKSGSAGQWYFKETGSITLNAALANASGNYQGNSSTGFATKGTLELRFVPHHFNTDLIVTSTTPAVVAPPMNCTTLGGYSNPCTLAPTGYYVYSGQGFTFKVSAYKDDTTLSQNYRVKTASTADLSDVAKGIAMKAASASLGAEIAATEMTVGSGTAFTFATAGIGLVSSSALPTLSFASGKLGPTTAFLRAVDDDGATSARTGATEAPLTVVTGRMMISNAYGSSTSAVPVEVRAMYYSSAAGTYLFNPMFSPAASAKGGTIPLAAGSGLYTGFSNCSGTLTNLQLVPGKLQFVNGKATLSVAKSGASGTACVSLQSSVIDDGTSNHDYIPYLPVLNPGRVTFGVYRSGPVVYTREVYN